MPLFHHSPDYQVLIIEDDPDLGPEMLFWLTEKAYHAKLVSRPDEALVALRQYVPPVTIVDIMLVGQSGVTLAKQIQRDFDQTSMIAVSAADVEIQQAEDSGLFHAVVPKPFDLERLISCIDQIIQRPKPEAH